MRRRTLVVGLQGLLATLSWRKAVAASPMRIGQVFAGEPGTPTALELEKGLLALGLVRGGAFTLQTRFAAPNPGAMREAIASLLPGIDLLVAWGTIGGVAAKSLAPSIPVVFLSVGAPVEIGLVASLAHPGGTMTGISFEAADATYAKRLQLLKEIRPTLATVGVLGARGDANVPFALRSLTEQAPAMGVRIVAVEFGSAADLDAAFAAFGQQGVEAMIAIAGSLALSLSSPIAERALANRLPSCHGFRQAVEAGGLISLGPDLNALARQGARLVAKIIAGAKPADIPVEQPTEYAIALNLATARKLGITLSPALIARADSTVE